MHANTFQHMLLGHYDYYGDPSDFGWDYRLYDLEKSGLAIDDNYVEITDKNEHVEGNWNTSLYIVFRVDGPDGVNYFRKTGYYQSHDGSYWDGPMVEVFPQTKVVTVWDETEDYDSFDGAWDSYGNG